MTRDRSIDVETAKKLLKNVCDFLEVDESGVADFKITNGKEAVLMSLYTGSYYTDYPGAFFILDEDYKFKFIEVASACGATEPLGLATSQDKFFYRGGLVPIFSPPISQYFKFFPNLSKPKFLFMIDSSKYLSRKVYLNEDLMIKDVIEKAKANGISLSDCVLWPSAANGTYGEDFWEYVSGIVLRNKGYFVTKYILTGEDLTAYFIPEYLEKLVKRGFLNKGAFLEELEMLEFLPKTDFSVNNKEYEVVCIEAESSEMRTKSYDSSGKAGVTQLLRYLDEWEAGYTFGFVAGPFTELATFTKLTNTLERHRKRVGLISCDENGNLIFYKTEVTLSEDERNKAKEKIEIMKKVIKCSLLKNLSFEERCELIGVKPTNINEYFEKILSLDIDTILDKIEEKLKLKK